MHKSNTIGTILLLISLAGTGCRDPRRAPHAPQPTSAPAAVDLSDPAGVARAFLDASRVLLDVGQQGMRDAGMQESFNQAKARIAQIADYDGVAAQYRSPNGRAAPAGVKEVWTGTIVNNWPSLVAHYIRGLRLETLRVNSAATLIGRHPVSASAQQAAMVIARGPQTEGRLAALRREAAQVKDVRGQPLAPGTAEYNAWVRRKAVGEGFSPSPGVVICIGLRQTNSEWRIVSVAVEPLPVEAGLRSPASTRPGAATQTVGRAADNRVPFGG